MKPETTMADIHNTKQMIKTETKFGWHESRIISINTTTERAWDHLTLS